MRALWMVGLLAVVALAGCFSSPSDNQPDPMRPDPVDVPYDPEQVEVTGVRKDSFTFDSFDGTTLSAVAYIPETSMALDDGAFEWPVIVFLHGLGFFKEQFEGTEAIAPGANPEDVPEVGGESPEEFRNILQKFAEAGFIAVAYDARGHGQSEGSMTVAGPSELADFDYLLDYVETHYDASDRIGVTGTSYGGGQSLQALVSNPKVDTAVPMFGWIDLYDALLPDQVPKLEWIAALGAIAAGSNRGPVHPMLTEWYNNVLTRQNLDEVEAQMDARSTRHALPSNDKPLLVCQGMQESLFPQADEMALATGGFARTYIYTGGHNLIDTGCLQRALAWFEFFLAGKDTGVDTWPALETQDVSGDRFTSFERWPETSNVTWYLRDPDLASQASPNVDFTIEQRLVANPFSDPAVVAEAFGPGQALPEQFRQDPAAIFFTTPVFAEAAVIVGAPELTLTLDAGNQTGWQVTGQLLVTKDGRSQIISRAAYAALNETHLEDGQVTLRFHYTKAQIDAGSTLSLKLSANDPSWWMPLLQDYSITFTGDSRLDVPFFE